MPKDSIALLFSGGLDTTIEVADRLNEYRTVHCITFNNGCCINVDAARRRAAEIDARSGRGRVVFTRVSTAPLLKRLLAERHRLPRDCRSPLVFDLACKMASLTTLILYAKQRGITDISDGVAKAQDEVFLQQPAFMDHIEPFAAEYGLNMLRPVRFEATRAAKLARVRELGLDPGNPGLEKIFITGQLRHQPFCLRGIITFFFTSPLRHLALVRRIALPTDRALRVWDLLLPAARAYLDGQLADGAPALCADGDCEACPACGH